MEIKRQTTGNVFVPTWMFALQLPLVETVCYAVIYGYCRNCRGYFLGNAEQMAHRINVTRRQAKSALKHLIQRELIECKYNVAPNSDVAVYTATEIELEEIINNKSKRK
jgi:hypothetical protein